MTTSIPKIFLEKLGELLASGHRQFGKVATRRPYKDDDEGGSGSPQNLFEEHPLLSQMPIGAPSDLTFLPNENKYSEEAAVESNQLSPQLKKQLELTLGHKLDERPKMAPPTLTMNN